MGNPRYDASLNQFVHGSVDDDVAHVADGAISHTPGVHALTKGSAGAYTLAAPIAAQEGTRLVIVSRTAFAHVVTVTGGLGGRGAAADVLTFGGNVGDSIELIADGLFWVPVGAPYNVVIA